MKNRFDPEPDLRPVGRPEEMEAELAAYLGDVPPEDLANLPEEQWPQALPGPWEALCYCVRREQSRRWESLLQYPPGRIRWTFHPEGMLCQQAGQRPPKCYPYFYHPDTRELFVALTPHFETSGDEDHYRILLLSRRLLWLHDLHDDDFENGTAGGMLLWRREMP